MERVKGIEPSSQAWEARILPLNHTRFRGALARPAILAINAVLFNRLMTCWQQLCTASPRHAQVIDSVA